MKSKKKKNQFKKKKKLVEKWLNKKYSKKINFEYRDLIVYGFLFQLLASLYYFIFFSEFNISYFLYFHPADSIYLAHEILTVILVILFLFSFLFSPLIIIAFSKKKSKKKNKTVLIHSVIISVVIVAMYLLYGEIRLKIAFSENIILGLCLIIIMIITPFIKNSYSRIIYLFILIAIIWKSATSEANHFKNNIKQTFNLIDKQDNVILEEENTCRFYLRRTSSSIFIVDTCKNEIDVIPVSEIKKINFRKDIFKK